MADNNQQCQNNYVQVKNPEPAFMVPQDYIPWPFSLKLMAKAEGFTEGFEFDIASAISRRDGKRKRKPPVLRRKAMNALLMAMCFYYDPLSNKVQRTPRDMAFECGLARHSLTGEVSIERAVGALESLEKDFGFVYCSSACYATAEIFLTPRLFEFLNVFPQSLSEAKLKCLDAKSCAKECADE
ncbi:replication protein [Salmonella enterica]|uniref:plasmid replication initiator RepA n=1 Tax=Salmonella enterica TaxID=28901 RepID=UPI000BA0199A|nr:plasmid replication initiator RepA [Salmonella enterica]EBV7253174.1 replication protein [Salmonella enterica subsp. enterica serovar Pomona]EGA8870302.1 replication protein [Salmonella enterica subsp. enterica serovar Oranienburg]EHM1179212.1 replication protein [Salmonella enterica subsp. enterica serovar Urbana]EHX0855169.1 replication protein [Salmonella enterica subsp. enterica]EAR4972047.1 replication protein [Salmonella enterica]